LQRFFIFTMENEQYNIATLPNGIRLLHRRKPGEIAHLVLVVGTGSRDELEPQNGMAHFIEHTVFKGTQNRKPYHILSCLDNVGGDLNAFTTKEETCLQASFLNAYYRRAMDLLSDIAFQATFPEHELEKEKEVVLDEINSYLDMPSEEIYDVFEDTIFKGHPLGRNILGTSSLVKGFSRDDVLAFREGNYSTDSMVLATIGDISFSDFEKLAQQFFGCRPPHLVPSHRETFKSYAPCTVTMERNNHLSHCMIGGLAPDFSHPRKRTMVLLNNILGGPAMNSRLSLNIREKYGFAYTIESQYNAYSDVGLFNVYMGVDPDSLDKAISLVYKELDKLSNQRLGTMQLHHAKQQLIGQLALGRESGMSELLALTRSMLMNEPIESIPEIIQTIEVITADDLMAEANEVFDHNRLTTLVFRGSK
jgi:predicted Zn-dependent peptidase